MSRKNVNKTATQPGLEPGSERVYCYAVCNQKVAIYMLCHWVYKLNTSYFRGLYIMNKKSSEIIKTFSHFVFVIVYP